uniref:NADH-ubiquinone oxidoreductase chain 6 n=1 Tax=Uranoscopus japonicus TaxID=70848 RepID=A0A1V1FZ43_URAJA|nr:NADH dehydrogenase subunit 6 [Uranoscopus japonicus]BAX03823.1 NADH dehydrogenase subunit 6 [Uranoscopus japonicus]BBU26122.1 NADH dehydrogenase subunit 6 [Uranoscopus japonicus]
MTYIITLFLLGLVLGLIAVASNPSPYYGALGLVAAAGMGCGVLLGYGGCFMSLVLFMIYLGGMLVVFAYSAALSAEPFPESWGSREVKGYVGGFAVAAVTSYALLGGGRSNGVWACMDEGPSFSISRGDAVGAASMYSSGGGLLFISTGCTFLTLFVVLELTRGRGRGPLRAV